MHKLTKARKTKIFGKIQLLYKNYINCRISQTILGTLKRQVENVQLTFKLKAQKEIRYISKKNFFKGTNKLSSLQLNLL